MTKIKLETDNETIANPALLYQTDGDDAISPTGQAPTYHPQNPVIPQTFPEQRQYGAHLNTAFNTPSAHSYHHRTDLQAPHPLAQSYTGSWAADSSEPLIQPPVPFRPVSDQAPVAPVAPQQPPPSEDNRVPIPRNARQTLAPMTVAATGPMSKAVNLKPRAKPGRKPMEHDDATDRRRTQNRDAQRVFRDKRQKKCELLQAEIDTERKARQDDEAEHRRQMHQLQERHQAEVAQLQDRITNLGVQARAPVLQAPNPGARPHQDSAAAFTIPENIEEDFTTYGSGEEQSDRSHNLE